MKERIMLLSCIVFEPLLFVLPGRESVLFLLIH